MYYNEGNKMNIPVAVNYFLGGFALEKIVIIFTGGTISMKNDPNLNAAIPSLSGNDILKMVPNIKEIAQIEIIQFGNFPSPYFTPELLINLRREVENVIMKQQVKGVVITHGTDTIEETAYFLDLTINSEKPIVLTGAMKNSSEVGYDGPSNLIASVITASSVKAKNKGVLVVFNNEIHAARDVTKTHTSSIDTFKSLETGPIGVVDNNRAYFYRNIEARDYIPVDHLEPRVSLLKVAFGMDDKIIRFLVDSGEKGIVIEGTGRGNVPPKLAEGIEYAISKGVIVVLVSRCPMGRVDASYGYKGGGKHLESLGVIFGGNLSGQKARIKLMAALAYSNNYNEIKKLFKEQRT
ncbi:L-asparaginase [Thermoanaerobacter thermohydrosulfuricus]|uniref:asparaginase n=2 Tax=Thermoanaerobacter thermohydrosulfuricus TaxID=1516 RepID=M8CLU4_THETY|nr:L-asparaginase/archaeal Glu-tRNAGln amidotransferase subunit D [Thermoanaerobacter thermohydrosulfuricus WC1]SDF28065.1 L-asparaginase [Thermoanaerobacter thermohydrosulfuricus]SFE36238.1 L-asparaginase [Thermoanaerobacter thermohydrosulfuricus]